MRNSERLQGLSNRLKRHIRGIRLSSSKSIIDISFGQWSAWLAFLFLVIEFGGEGLYASLTNRLAGKEGA